MLDFFIYGFKGKMLIVTLVIIFISLVFLLSFAINGLGFKTGDQPIIVDNTKKRMLIVTANVLECYQNNTGCEVIATKNNVTELGNVSKGPMRSTKL